MTYELALKLKEAGFSQAGEGGEVYNDKFRGDGTIENGFFIRKPSLSELIEVCGDKFFRLEKIQDGANKGTWIAWAKWGKNMQTVEWTGSTPEEAVANLWLSINNK